MDRIEALLNEPCWIIDILPARVPADSPGQYFRVEEYFLKERREAIKEKHIALILKLNCYRDLELEGETDPAPARLAEILRTRPAALLTGDALILSEPDDTYLTLYHPDAPLLALVKALAAGEGLYVWPGQA